MNYSVPEKLQALREKMAARHIDAYLVPTEDFHSSEYVGDYFKCRKYISGFTGSAGTALIFSDRACLWTDARYFLQAEAQLEGSTFTLFRSGEPGVPTLTAYLKDQLPEGGCLGFDGRTVGALEAEGLSAIARAKGGSICQDLDLVGEIWEDRPALSCEKAWELDIRYAGVSREEKLQNIHKILEEKKADRFLLTSLDDIAWLLNIRGADVHCNPVVLSYLVMEKDRTLLFADKRAFSEELLSALEKDHVELRPYDSVYDYAAQIPADSTVLLCRKKVNSRLVSSLPEGITVLDEENPTLLPKAVKNPVEVGHMREAHIKDGVAVTHFIYWLKTHVGKETVTELSAEEKLYEFRSMQEHFLGNSFDPIISYGSHAAIVHYSATPETNIPLKARGFVLCDTGGQYLEGTTDITRTVALGPVSEEEKRYFTAVLRGHLNLGAAKFLYGCTGQNLDYLARGPLWEMGEDYKHGTGHGVGFLLNVHEGPNGFRWKTVPERNDSAILEEGMITSDEPGYYRAGAFGIRHENLIVCRKAEENEAGQFMCFEHLTMVPFDLDGIDFSLMNPREIQLLNAYHQKVFETISPCFEGEELEWLKQATRPVN